MEHTHFRTNRKVLSGGMALPRVEGFLRRFCRPSVPTVTAAWLLAATTEFALLPTDSATLTGLTCLQQMSLPRLLCMGMLFYAALSSLPSGSFSARRLLFVTFAGYAGLTLCRSFSAPLLFACLVLAVVAARYVRYGWDASARPVPACAAREGISPLCVTTAAGTLLFLLLSVWGIARIRSFCVSSFDYGIFAQMFHYLKTTGQPLTTLERGELLSHFAVHLSPIWYLLLPFYCLAPYAETLPVLQAAVLVSSLVPLWKLGRQHGLNAWLRTAVCALLLLYPAFAGGTGYDIHENCFLAPLLLWLFYALDRKNAWLTALFAVLTCLVKEDAPVYVAVIGLYVLLRGALHRDKRDGITGAAVFLGAIAYFLAALWLLRTCGEGAMVSRYSNLIYGDSNSLLSIITGCLLCPMKFLCECTESEKLGYIALTMLPLFGLPLATRRYERFVLLIPYLLVNLATDYSYQHDIFFQYSFGSAACLIYLTTVNLSELRPDGRRFTALTLALSLSLGCFGGAILPRVKRYITYCDTYGETYDARRAALSQIPAEASVAATTMYTPQLYDRDILFDIRYTSTENILSCEYIVLNRSETKSFSAYAVDGENGAKNFVSMLLASGYTLIAQPDSGMEIYRKTGIPTAVG